MKKVYATLLAIALLLTCIPLGAVSVSAATSGGYTYTVSNGEATITSYSTHNSYGVAITIPSTLGGYPVTSIRYEAFYDCDSLTSVTIPDSVTSIGYDAFYSCDSLTSVTIGDSVTSIGEYAFFSCDSLTSVTIGDSVTSIGRYAFCSCDSLTSVTIPDSVTSIGEEAFSGCTSLTSINVDQNSTKYCSVDGVLFNKEKTTLIQYPAGKTLTEYSIPDSVTSIGYSAFDSCDSLTSVTIPDSVTSIGDAAFYYCTSLTSVTIPDNVTSIGDSAFSHCTSLTSVTIPDSVTSIGNSAFYECYQLTDVWYTGSGSDRNAITIASKNSCLNGAIWHYNTCTDEHSFANDCDTDCDTCGWVRTVNPHPYDNACDAVCNECGDTRTPSHVFDNACDTTCNECGATRTITHDYADATCTAPKTCTVCGVTEGEALGHTYSNACDKSCNRCKATRTVAGHDYEKKVTKATTTKNGTIKHVCTKCGYTASKVTTLYKASKISLSTTSYTYTGSVKKPSVTVKDSKGKTISSKYYTVTYASGRKNVGTYKVTVKFKGNYSGTKTLTFKINPAKTTLGTLTAAKKALTVKWTKKSTQVTGYQIQYSTSKSFKSYKTKTVSSYKTTSTKLTGLSAKKTYYVRVRTYKTVNGTKYYSGWSTIKYKKTK